MNSKITMQDTGGTGCSQSQGHNHVNDGLCLMKIRAHYRSPYSFVPTGNEHILSHLPGDTRDMLPPQSSTRAVALPAANVLSTASCGSTHHKEPTGSTEWNTGVKVQY